MGESIEDNRYILKLYLKKGTHKSENATQVVKRKCDVYEPNTARITQNSFKCLQAGNFDVNNMMGLALFIMSFYRLAKPSN